MPSANGVSSKQLARELRDDLPDLWGQFPKGPSIQDLHAIYGDPPTKILRAISILERWRKVRVYRALNHVHYILPFDAPIPTEEDALSELQQQTLAFLRKTSDNGSFTQIRTNYSQLARILKCSSMGIRTCINRLQILGYLQILEPSANGKQANLLLGLLPKAIKPKETPILPLD